MTTPPPTIAVSAARARLRDETCPTTAHWASNELVSAILGAGGVPVVVPVGLTDSATQALVGRADGLVLTGGEDVSLPGVPHRGDRTDALRDGSEQRLLLLARRRGLPVLGVCRGMQLLAVTGGGELGAIRGHASPSDSSLRRHEIRVGRASLLGRLAGHEPVSVTSLHQFAVTRTGEFVATAWALDGIIEAIEHPIRWELGLQWHPELEPDVFACRIWEALVDAAREHIRASA